MVMMGPIQRACGPYRLTSNSQATATTRLRLYELAIASLFVFSLKNSWPCNFRLATQSVPLETWRCRFLDIERGIAGSGPALAVHAPPNDWVVELPDRFMCVYVAAADTLKLP